MSILFCSAYSYLLHIHVGSYCDRFDITACGHFISPCVSEDDNVINTLDIYSMDQEVPTYVSLTQQLFNTTTCESESFISSVSMNMELVSANDTNYISSLKDVRLVFGAEAASSAQCTTTIEPGVSYSILYSYLD